MTRRTLVGVGAWATTAAVATGIGLATISVLGAGITDRSVRPLTSHQVERALAGPQADSQAPGTRSSAPPGGITRGLSTPGGTVLARCSASGTAYLISWTPAQGYWADDHPRRGPAPRVWVEFKSGRHHLTAQVTCRSGVPVAAVTDDDADKD